MSSTTTSDHAWPTRARLLRLERAGARRCARAACEGGSASHQAWQAGCRALQLFKQRIPWTVNDRCVLRSRSNPGWALKVGLQAAEVQGHSVASQRSRRKNHRSARRLVVMQDVVCARVRAERRCRGLLGGCCASAVRMLCGACGRAVRGSWYTTGSNQNDATW